VSRRLRYAVGTGVVVVVAVVLSFGAARILDDDGRGASGEHAVLASALARMHAAAPPFTGLTEVRAAVGGRCLRLAVADTEAERVAGLRGTPDLRPFDGMLFVFDGSTDAAFTMSGVTDPLDIAFFGADGTRGSSRLMKPCAKAEQECPVYRADDPFLYALETPAGAMPAGALAPCSSA
jgi:uncharacterized membrane protein (UPF0127 family)